MENSLLKILRRFTEVEGKATYPVFTDFKAELMKTTSAEERVQAISEFREELRHRVPDGYILL